MNRSRGIRSALLLAASAAILSSCGAVAPRGEIPVLSGRVTYRGAPVTGARVALFPRYDGPGRPPLRTAVTVGDGGFRMETPRGSYFAVAEGTFETTPVFAFSGQNPVRVESGTRWLGMKAVPVVPPVVRPAPAGRGAAVSGTVLSGDAPVENAFVTVYPGADSGFKGMGIAMSPPTGPDGRFEIGQLPESAYFLVARRRGSGGMTGPLEKGDLYGFYPGNPAYLKEGAETVVRIDLVEKEKPLSYSEVTAGTETMLRGRVVDRGGRPQAGVYAFVYDDRVFGHQRPFGHSGRTGADGAFVIYLDRPGTYYLGARENFGNSPKPGERFGFYDGTPDHAVTAVAGKAVEGLTIVVQPILPEEK
ncbi:MAG: hypothetical protein OHK0028_16900 [Deltaproteobacteria bacterium]